MSFKENNQDIDFDKEFPAFLIGNKCDLEHTIDDFEIEISKMNIIFMVMLLQVLKMV